MIKCDFSYYLTKFFSDYLPNTLGASINTIKSYKDSFILFLEYFDKKKNIHSSKITFENISSEFVEEFINWLEEEKQMAITTRNQRLAAIHSFFKYIKCRELQYFDLCTSILQIKFKKSPTPIVSYLSKNEIQFLFNIPNKNLKQEYRDLTLMVTLYDTGARVQELIDLKLKDIRLDEKPTIYLTGKGQKTRIVPINEDTKCIIKKYIKDNSIVNMEDYLFTNKQGKPLTREGINYILNKYISIGKRKEPSYFRNKISPHCFRHSKAMHLLEAGVNLIYIRDFLGHTSVLTTEIYAKTNPEIKRKIIEENSANLKIDNKYDSKKKEELLEWLKNNI